MHKFKPLKRSRKQQIPYKNDYKDNRKSNCVQNYWEWNILRASYREWHNSLGKTLDVIKNIYIYKMLINSWKKYVVNTPLYILRPIQFVFANQTWAYAGF